MRFALLGSHPDGLEMASALVESGRHELLVYTGQLVGPDYLGRWGERVRRGTDLEDVLADPAVEAVIVAGTLANRPVQLRRAVQSERHVLCVHPPDHNTDTGHEAALIQTDTKCILLPLLTEALHPGVGRLRELVGEADAAAQRSGARPLGPLRLILVERSAEGAVLLDGGQTDARGAMPGWDVLRRLGGEIAEVSAFTAGEGLSADEPVLLSGRFERGGLFQATLLPGQPRASAKMVMVGSRGRAELFFPMGWSGPAFLSWRDETGELREEAWENWDPWPALVEGFEAALAGRPRRPAWQDAVRALELDDAARRSAERRRANVLEYPEATEEVGFKGTMTLVGCGLLWGVLALAVVSIWLPWVAWAIIPLMVFFIALQGLRWVAPPGEPGDAPGRG